MRKTHKWLATMLVTSTLLVGCSSGVNYEIQESDVSIVKEFKKEMKVEKNWIKKIKMKKVIEELGTVEDKGILEIMITINKIEETMFNLKPTKEEVVKKEEALKEAYAFLNMIENGNLDKLKGQEALDYVSTIYEKTQDKKSKISKENSEINDVLNDIMEAKKKYEDYEKEKLNEKKKIEKEIKELEAKEKETILQKEIEKKQIEEVKQAELTQIQAENLKIEKEIESYSKK